MAVLNVVTGKRVVIFLINISELSFCMNIKTENVTKSSAEMESKMKQEGKNQKRVWLVYGEADINRNLWYIQEYLRIGPEVGLFVELIQAEELTIGIQNQTWYLEHKGKEAELPDAAIVRTIYPMLSRQLEQMGVLVYNPSSVAEICNDKARTLQYVAKLQIPVADTRFVRNGQVERYRKEHPGQYVIKAVDGHGGSQVYLAEESDEFCVSQKLGASDAVVQPLLPTRQDLRVYVLGKRILAAVLRTAKKGFRANYSLGGEVCLYQLSKQETELVNQIIELFDFGLAGIDFFIGEHQELILNEIEDVVGARMLYQCTNLDLVRTYLQFISEQLG